MSKSAKSVFTPSNDNIAFANAIVQSLDALAVRRQQWETTDYKKANDGLYALLADSLDVFQSKFVNADDDNRKTLRNELHARLKAAGVKVQVNSTTLTMFVRFVFSSDRKRAHGYAYVLKAAISHEVAATNLPTWIVAQGGIEEIKRKMVMSEQALAKRAAVTAATLDVKTAIEEAAINPLATVALPNVTGEYAILLGKPQPDGTVAVVGVLPEISEGLYKTLVTRLARLSVENKVAGQALHNEVNDLFRDVAANSDTFIKAA